MPHSAKQYFEDPNSPIGSQIGNDLSADPNLRIASISQIVVETDDETNAFRPAVVVVFRDKDDPEVVVNPATPVALPFTQVTEHSLASDLHTDVTLAELSAKITDAVLAASAAALTSGRVPYVTAGGLLLDDATFSYASGTGTLNSARLSCVMSTTTGTAVTGSASASGATDSGYGGNFLTAGGAGRAVFLQCSKTGAYSPVLVYGENSADTGYGLRLSAYQNYLSGSLGIGVAIPTEALHIEDLTNAIGALIKSNDDAYMIIHAGADGSSANAYALWQQNGGSTNYCLGFSDTAGLTPCGGSCTDALAWAFQVIGTSSDHVQLGANNVIYITIRNGGNIGIHTNNPQAVLDIRGDIRVDVTTAALGGGASATLGTIGGSGPATAGQNQWARITISGSNYWIPVWQ